MLKTIKSFFQSLTREQLEQKTLSDMQEARLRKNCICMYQMKLLT
jgi:hypothetical protein